MKAHVVAPCLGILLLALGLRWHLAHSTAFDGLYGQDAFAYWNYAQDLRHVQLPNPTYWPLGFPLLLTITSRTPSDSQRLVLVMGASIAPLTYLLILESLRLEGWSLSSARRAGMVAGLIIAFCGQLIQSSLVVMADGPSLWWAVVSAVGLLYYRRTEGRGRWAWLAVAAWALAWATISRWLYGVLIPVWALYFWQHKHTWRDGLWALVPASVVLLPQLLVSQHSLIHHAWLEGWQAGNALRRDFVNVDGTFHYPHLNAVYYTQSLYDGWYLHRIWVGFTLVGLGRMVWERHGWLWLGWFGCVWGFLVGIPYQNIRFLLPLMIPVAVWCGVGVESVWTWLGVALRRRYRLPVLDRVARGWLLLVVGVAVWSSYPLGKVGYQYIVETKNTDLTVIRRTEAAIEPDAVVYCMSLWTMMGHYTDIEMRQLFYEDPATIVENLPQDRPVYLLINGWLIEHRWQGQAPWLSVHALLDNPGMIRLALWGSYHLYQVKNQWWGHQ